MGGAQQVPGSCQSACVPQDFYLVGVCPNDIGSLSTMLALSGSVVRGVVRAAQGTGTGSGRAEAMVVGLEQQVRLRNMWGGGQGSLQALPPSWGQLPQCLCRTAVSHSCLLGPSQLHYSSICQTRAGT